MTDGSTGPRAATRRAALIATAAVLLAMAIPASASAFDYVAMGDSYSSGTGTRTYYEGCERSVFAYGYLIKGSLGSSFKHIACSGATTQDVLNNQLSSLDAGTKYVTISVGGNDAGFSSVITECAKPIVSCNSNITNAQNTINNTLPGRLDNVYNQIRARAPNAVVGVVGYPRLFNGTDCNALTFFSGDEMTKLNQTADILASVTRTRAAAHGFTFIDARGAFLGHAVCDNPEWLNGLSNPTGESYHPNSLGHSTGYQGIVRTALLAAPKPNAPVGGNGRIAFVSSRDGNNEVYVINADGQFPINLTNDASSDIDPEWSPDGTKVAFASNRDGDNEIYVMNGDGSGVTRLTNNSADDREPAWSPNGAYLTFRSNRDGDPEIFTMAANGTGVSQKTANTVDDFGPDWSRDGAELVWQRTSGNNEIYKSNADGQGQTNLTNNGANDGRPAWGPNGNIAFHSNRDGDFEIFTMNALGGSVTQRTTSPARDEDPSWSPDGQQITYQSDRASAGNLEIFTMNANGIGQTQRTNNPATDNSPSWQADSTPPSTKITAGPAGPTGSARPSFEFAASELGSSLQCKIDNGPFANCSSPYQTPQLADGEHTISFRSIDPSGNVGTTAATRTFVVDTVTPDVQLTCPASVLLNSDASAAVVATDRGSGLGALDDPTGDHALDTTQPGTRTFSIHAIDLAGNRGEAECSYDVRYPDPGTPALSAGESPNAGAFTIGWTASAASTYPIRYVVERRDAGAGGWTEVRSGIDGATLAFTAGDPADEGTWTYRVRGIDAENGVETGWSAASDPVKVDQAAPAKPSLTPDRAPEYAGDGGWFRDSVTVTTTDNGDPDLRDGSAPSGVDPASVADPQTLDAGGTLMRTVRDRVANESAQAELTVQVDTRDPELALDCPASAALLTDASATVIASDDQSGLADDPSGTVKVDTNSVGTKVIERTATDNVGHSRTERCQVLVYYPDPGAPAVTDGGNPNGGDFTVGWQRSAPAGYPIRYTLERRAADGGDWAEVRSGIDAATFAFNRGDVADEGTWRYRVKGVDAENQVETGWSELSDTVKVDQTAPTAPTITADRAPEYAGDGGWFRDSVTVTTTDNGDPDLRDGSAPTGVDPASVAAPETLDASTTARRTVSDRVGNESAQAELPLQVDTHAPSLALDCPTSVYLRGKADAIVTAADGQSGLAQDPSGTVAIDTSAVGTQVIERTATDNVGHSRTERCEVLVRYRFVGLFKLDSHGRSVFKRGSTIPLRFVLLDANWWPVRGAGFKVQMERLSPTGEVLEVVDATPANSKDPRGDWDDEDEARYSKQGWLYKFNLSTRPLTTGPWAIRITPDDGTVHRTEIALR